MAGSSPPTPQASRRRQLTDGVSISDLAVTFRKDKRTVSKQLCHWPASGEHLGHPVYDLADACRHLTYRALDIEAHRRQADSRTVLPLLLKEYRSGQVLKQKFKVNEANRWPADDVKPTFTEVHEKLSAGIRIFSDRVEAQTGLSDKQRGLLASLSGGLLRELRRTLLGGGIGTWVRLARRSTDVMPALVKDDGL